MSRPSKDRKKLRWALVSFFLLLQFGIIGWAIKGVIPETEIREVEGYVPWSEEVIEAAATIPVQDGGRIKPLLTFARFQMLTYHGSLKLKILSGGEEIKIGPMEWMLDVLLRPEMANQLPIFRIDDSDILKQFGIETPKRRARLSMDDITAGGDAERDGFMQIIAKAQEVQSQLQEKPKASYTLREKQLKRLQDFAEVLYSYRLLTPNFDLVRDGLPPVDTDLIVGVNPQIKALLDERMDPANPSYWILIMPQLQASLTEIVRANPNAPTDEARQLATLGAALKQRLELGKAGLHLLPPHSDDESEWRNLGETASGIIDGSELDIPRALGDFRALQNIVYFSDQPQSEDLVKAIESFRDLQTERASERAEGEVIPAEVSYYERNYFMNGLVFFLVAFLVSAIGWVFQKGWSGRILHWIVITFFLFGVGYVVAGLFHRYAVTGRPPVAHLYDTIPFITAVAVILMGLAELLTRRRLLVSLGSAIGVIGLFFAFRFEFGDAQDNMDPLRAVLDSNYWLATHVVTISMGYSGGLVACFMSTVYAYIALSGVIDDQRSFGRFMTRAVYGITCFTLFFSLVGTVLGGIWANDSWGRFWGWDPKENGALLIVLWSLIILHARLAGWLKDWGIHLLSILGGSVVVFSWWGVNMLEVGLHSYGFVKGANSIWFFYGATVVAWIAALVARYLGKKAKSQPRADSEIISGEA